MVSSIIGMLVLFALLAVVALVAFMLGWKLRDMQTTFHKADLARAYRDKYEAENKKLKADLAQYRNYEAMGKQAVSLFGAAQKMWPRNKKAGA